MKEILLTKESKKIITRRPNGTIRVQTHNNDPSLTDPQWTQEADINSIMEKFSKGQMTTHLNKKQVYYSMDEVVPSMTLIEASMITQKAMDDFNQLPATVRERFNNDPAKLHDFLLNPNNLEEAVKLNLVTKTVIKNDDKLNDDDKNIRKNKPVKKADQTDPE